MSRLVTFVLLIMVTSCGKVADPRPPFIRIPEPIRDLTVSQDGDVIVLSWTNPARNIDGSSATDLENVHISRDGNPVADVPPTGPGKAQSYSLSTRGLIGTSGTFEVNLETSRKKVSNSSRAAITPVEVPGAVNDLNIVVDQYSVTLNWKPPSVNASLVDGYMVQRLDNTEGPSTVSEPGFRDSNFVPGREYAYEVVAARRVDGRWIRGTDPRRQTVLAVDKVAPSPPSGIEVIATDSGAIITWKANEELDLAGYKIFRDGQLLNPTLRTTNSFEDKDYRPGVMYSVSAVDQFGNEGPKSGGS